MRQRIKFVADINATSLAESTDDGFVFDYVDIGRVSQGFIDPEPQETTFGDAPSRARRLAQPGDSIVSTVRTYLRAVAQVSNSELPQVFSTGFAVLHPHRDKVVPRYLAYYLQSDHFVDRVVAESVGVSYPAINASDLAALDLELPSKPDQELTADFLDRETAQIDALVAEQRGLVRLLEERRRVVIDQAVRTGLRGAPPTQDTGIPWIGSIPEHWEAQRIGNLARALIGLTYDPADIVDGEDAGTLVLRSGNIQGGRITHDDCVYVSSAIPTKLRLRQGDLLICSRNGSARLIGKNALVGSEDVDNTWGAFMSVLRSSLSPYLRWVLNSSIFAQQLGLFATSTINQLTTGALHSMRIPLPPRDERDEIVHHLETTTARTDAMIDAANESIALMLERRSALISAAVTGRIDPHTGQETKEAS